MIVLQCNDLYFDWLIFFLESYQSTHNKAPVFISIFNGTDAMMRQCLSYGDHITVELDNNNRYDLPLEDHTLRECMTSRKVFVLADVIERFELDWVLMLDVDTLCRKNLAPWIRSLQADNVDMAVVKNIFLTDDDYGRWYSASTVYFSKSAFHVVWQWLFYIQLKESMLGAYSFQFFWDQICLYATIENYINHLNIAFLDRFIFIDESFNNDAYFWTWGTPVEGAKHVMFDFFDEYKNGRLMTVDSAQHYMNVFFDQGYFRESFVFANIVVKEDPQEMSAIFILAVVYFKELKNYGLAKDMFLALKKNQFRIDECSHYLHQIELLD